MPLFSVIIPVFNDPVGLDTCLESLERSEFRDYEVLVASESCSPRWPEMEAVAARRGARLVRLEYREGPGPARNAAARLAFGEYLVFIDADETVHPETLTRIAEAFDRDPSLDAVVGSYDLAPGCRGLPARFRNLLHAYVHRRSAGEISTFWTGCGAVRRKSFETLLGFNHAIEDVEFGLRLHRAGGRILLDPAIQVKHCKEWTVATMVRTDVVLRAAPWIGLMMEHGLPPNLNFRWIDRWTVALAALIPLLAVAAALHGGVWPLAALASVSGVALLQWPLFLHFRRDLGVGLALASFPLYLLHLWSAAAGFLLGLARWEIRRDRWLPVAALAIAALVFGVVQWAGGAYGAEFEIDFDESSHYVTSLFVHDYLTAWPPPDPLPWAERYYLHYPRVSFGHWPPLFYLLQAAWWLFLPPARWSALLLTGGLAVASALAFYRLARQAAPVGWALAATLLLLAAPVFQASAAAVMTDQLNLLLSMLFLHALARFFAGGGSGAAAAAFACAALSVLVRGTGLCLIPAPFVGAALSGQWRGLKRLAIPAAALGAVLGACAALYLWQTGGLATTLKWAGAFIGAPWPVANAVEVAGAGILLAAAAAVPLAAARRKPLETSAAALLLSTALCSLVLTAMNTPRHWIGILPALLLLALSLVRWLRETLPARAGSWTAAAVCVLLLAAFPWTFSVQRSAGSEALLAQVAQPSRFLVSTAAPVREGGWVALIASRERRPSSVVVRSSKFLARFGRGTNRYRPLYPTAEQTLAVLDRHRLSTVIVDNAEGYAPAPAHHVTLRSALLASADWRRCAQTGALEAYCRATPPRLPREPLKVRLGRFGIEYVSEE